MGAYRAFAVGHHHKRLPDHERRRHDEPQVYELVRKLRWERSGPARRGEERAVHGADCTAHARYDGVALCKQHLVANGTITKQ